MMNFQSIIIAGEVASGAYSHTKDKVKYYVVAYKNEKYYGTDLEEIFNDLKIKSQHDLKVKYYEKCEELCILDVKHYKSKDKEEKSEIENQMNVLLHQAISIKQKINQ